MLGKTHSLSLMGPIPSASLAADGSGGSDLWEKLELTEFRANARVKGVIVSPGKNTGTRLFALLIHYKLQNKLREGLGK